MKNTKLNEILQTIKALKEQSSLAARLLDSNLAVKLENTEIPNVQSKINLSHIKVLDAYIVLQNINSYIDIEEKSFTEWWTQYELKEDELYPKNSIATCIMSEIAHDVSTYKKDAYTPYGTYYSEHLEIELKMPKQSYPNDAKAMACFYDNVLFCEDGSINYTIGNEAMLDTHVEEVTYRILPEDKRGLSMIKDTDYNTVTKEAFLIELSKINDRRFDSLAYRIEES